MSDDNEDIAEEVETYLLSPPFWDGVTLDEATKARIWAKILKGIESEGE